MLLALTHRPKWQVDSVGGRNMTALAAKVTASISEVKQVSFITAVLMAVALCFHSILEVSMTGCWISMVSCVVGEGGLAGWGELDKPQY